MLVHRCGKYTDRVPAVGYRHAATAASTSALVLTQGTLRWERQRQHDGTGGVVREQVRIREIPALLVSHDAGDAAFADGDAVRLG